ncbi:hypothetical protein [Rhodovulum strictum]|uniref:Uncharacterized protein n=1 Tax=Rhodovulum strictum TaxID=58314 RepID=A0A844BDQ6_9RHOB|nr:hypothetical protein [Rhodovulum strictum]MRH22634.1 hypothetical protein [Rhodovulum strictum]
MTDRELDEILTLRWPVLVRRAMIDGDKWTRSFVLSIARNGKRPNWRPTPKQEAIMRRLLMDMAQHEDQPPEVIEDEGELFRSA